MLRGMGGYAEGDEWLSLREMGGSLGSNPDSRHLSKKMEKWAT